MDEHRIPLRFTMQSDAVAGQTVEINPATGMLRPVGGPADIVFVASLLARETAYTSDEWQRGFDVLKQRGLWDTCMPHVVHHAIQAGVTPVEAVNALLDAAGIASVGT